MVEERSDSRSLLRRTAWVPIPCYLLFTALALGRESSWTFDPPWLITTLNVGCWLTSGLVVAYLGATAYTLTGAPAALLLGCGMLLLGLGVPLSAFLLGPLGVNAAVTLHNLVVLCAGGCLLRAAFLSLSTAPSGSLGAQRRNVVTSYLAVLVVLGGLCLLLRVNALPVFFQQGVGPTPLRQWVAGCAVVAFAVAGVFNWQAHAIRRIEFFRWHGSGLLLTALGLAVVLQEHRVGGLVSWAGRAGQFLGSFYIMMSLVLAWRDALQRRIGLGDLFATALSPTRTLQAALEDVPAVVWIAHDRAGRHISGNRAAQALLRLPPETEMSKTGDRPNHLTHFRVLHDGVELALDKSPVQRVAATGQAVTDYPLELVFDDGSVRSLMGNVTPVLGADGTPRGAIAVFLDVTERKQAEAALQASEERYRLAIKATNDAIWDLDLRLGTVHWNERYEQSFGRPPDTGGSWQWWIDHIHPDDRDRTADGLRDAIEGSGSTWTCRYRFLRADGMWADIFDRAYVARDPTGKAWRVIGAMQDQTESKQAEEALRESQARYHSLFNGMTEGFALHEIITDETGSPVDYRFLDINPAFERLTGLKRENVLGRRILEVLPDNEPSWLEAYGRVALTGEPARLESFSTPLDRWYEVFAYQPAPRQFAAIFEDITERKRAEEQLARSLLDTEQRAGEIEAVLAAINDAVLVYDADMHVVRVNPGFIPAYGFDPIGLHVRDIIERTRCRELDGRPLVLENQPTPRALRGESVVNRQLRITRLDGRECVLETSATPLRVGDRSVGTVTVWHDITKRQQAEEALRRAHEDLEQRVATRTAELSRALQQLSVQSEQLRSLASELTLVEQRERLRLAEQIHDGLQQLLVAARFRVAQMGRGEAPPVPRECQEIGQLLDEALDDSRSLTAELSPPILRTGGLLAGLEWLARWSREKHHLTVQVTTPAAPLPPLPEDLTVLLFQSVRELLFNTVKYARVPEATVTLAWAPPGLTLSVADAGAGFDPHGLRGEGGGAAGFGLARIRHRLELLGGCMTLETAPGQGTRVTLAVLLPTAAEGGPTPAPPQTTVLPQPAVAPESESSRTIRILLADDHQVVRRALAQLLGAEKDLTVVGEAGTGTSAVALARELAPDVILMDINMPELNGIEATRVIHAAFPAIRVIGLSMFDHEDQQAAMRNAGAVAYVSKSGPAQALLATIRACHRHMPPSATV